MTDILHTARISMLMSGILTLLQPPGAGPIHTNAFSKVSVLDAAKTKQNIFIHTSVFVSFSPVHTKTLKNDENDWGLGLRMC